MMTTEQKRKTLARIATCQHDLAELKRVRMELASGFESATMSSGNGSKSYRRIDLSKVNELIAELSRELSQYRTIIATGAARGTNTIVTVYC